MWSTSTRFCLVRGNYSEYQPNDPSLSIVFYKPYESKGEAWPITFARLMWGIVLFQVLMIGILTLSKSVVLSTLMLPLLAVTAYWGWRMQHECRPYAKFAELDKVFEAQRNGADAMTRSQAEEHITASHTYGSNVSIDSQLVTFHLPGI